MKKILLFPILAAVLFGWGCTSSTNPPPSSTPPPADGSTFAYHATTVYASLPTKDVAATDTLVHSGITYKGRSNVSFYHSTADDSSYSNYDVNGDVERYLSSPVKQISLLVSGWVTIPYGSGGSSITKILDTTIGVLHVQIADTATLLGFDTLLINGQKVATQKVYATGTGKGTFGSITQSQGLRDTIWYAPSLRYEVKSVLQNWSTGVDSTTTKIVTSTSVK